MRLKDFVSDAAKADGGELDSTWVRGSIAQLVVLASGLILTVVSYSTANVLVRNMLDEDSRQITAEAKEEVIDSFSNFQGVVQSVASIVALSASEGPESIKARIMSSLPGNSEFDRFVWLKRTAEGKWFGEDLANIRQPNQVVPDIAPGYEQAVVEHIAENRSRRRDEVFAVADLPGTKIREENSSFYVLGRPVVFARNVVVGGVDAGIVVGFTKTSRFLKESWLANRKSLVRIGVAAVEYASLIYYVDKEYQGGDGQLNLYPTATQDINAGNKKVWQIQIEIGKTGHTNLLEKTPLIILGFSALLTLVGTMYVRSSQRQSVKLTAMNRVLAQKNYALNSAVSERDRLSQTLRKAEREYRAIVDSVSDIIFEAKTDGEVLFLNETWHRITGFEVEQTLRRNLFDLIHPQDQEDQRANFNEMVKGKRSAYRSFTRLRTSDGTFRSVELAVSTIRHAENKQIRVAGTLTDVEERRRAERALGEAEKKYRQIVENAAGGIYQVTPEGQFLSANKALARILGYETPELLLRLVRNKHEIYISQKDRARFIRELETSGIVYGYETQVYTRDRKTIWVNENARVVKDDEGNILYFEGSLENVTQRKEAELKLREAKVQSDLANRAKSEFLANMSHELRTPLNAIIGFSEIIKNEVLGSIGNRQYWEYARDIHDSGKRLLTIINEILDVSRIEAGERQLNEGVVNMDKVIRSCIEFVQPKADAGNLSLVNATANRIPNLIGEELAVKQIMLNLLSNAVKYTPRGGRVSVSHEIDSTGQLRLSVTDTGIGLDDHELQKALAPFGQVETSLSREGSGAGLGLTLVESLMKMHGGQLELFSQKGIGTTATVIFPVRRVAAQQDGGPPSASGKGQQGKPAVRDGESVITEEKGVP